MSGGPEGARFTSAWRALSADERKELTRIANSGESSEDPAKAALIASLAERRTRPLELVAILIATVLGYVLVAQLILDGPEPAIVFGLAVGVAGFLIFQRRRLETARAKSLEILKEKGGG